MWWVFLVFWGREESISPFHDLFVFLLSVVKEYCDVVWLVLVLFEERKGEFSCFYSLPCLFVFLASLPSSIRLTCLVCLFSGLWLVWPKCRPRRRGVRGGEGSETMGNGGGSNLETQTRPPFPLRNSKTLRFGHHLVDRRTRATIPYSRRSKTSCSHVQRSPNVRELEKRIFRACCSFCWDQKTCLSFASAHEICW